MTTAATPICVIGAGTMGRGITQVALAAGHTVSLVDPQEAQLAAARADVANRLARRSPEIAAALDDRLHTFTSVDQAPVHPGTVVIEAVLESLDVKASVFAAAAEHFGSSCVLATNTSSLSVTAIAARSPLPHRVVGMHFFNPVPVMKLVEVISGIQTEPEVADLIHDLAVDWGKAPARAKNAPGFIVNRVARGFYGETLRLLQEQVGDPATIDAALRGSGFRMGPFELMDLIGNDVNAAVTRSVWTSFHFDPRFEPSRIQDELVDAGRLGRKSGHGFYSYADDATAPEPAVVTPGALPRTIDLGRCDQLASLVERTGLEVARSDDDGLSLDGVTVLVTRGRTARAESRARGGAPVVVVDRCISPTTVQGLAVAASHSDALPPVAAVLGRAGIAAYAVDDAPGLIVARTLAVIANEAWETTLHGIATADDIDVAMRLGTNYPAGPFAWTSDWGAGAVRELLDALWAGYHDTRYRASRALVEAVDARSQ